MADAALKLKLTEAMKDAMRARAQQRLGTIRLVLAEVKRIEVDERIELDDARILVVLDKMLKQRRDAASQFSQAGRQDLVDKENAEMEVIQSFLPAPLTKDELIVLVTQAIATSGATSVRDLGKVMALLKPQVQGRADMTAVSQLAKESLPG
ncbi:GatB/YqeY domain-containing protein [Balneatrix alpica]|uniref:GatB/YqeY domain-containing protein n=1 Tax=Balneatrix alpica TaxID=75684 RepID=A0ABV5ZD63_9GAMM|nr:GatB/YqeY domain-containing protein [Balneatrix alpica]